MKKKISYLLLLLLLIGVVFYFIGTMTITEHNQTALIDGEFMGYLTESERDAMIIVTPEDLPPWCAQYGIALQEAVTLPNESGQSVRAAIFLDFVQMEERITVRNMITGNLKTTQTRTYYRPEGQVRLELLKSDAPTPAATFDHDLIEVPSAGGEE